MYLAESVAKTPSSFQDAWHIFLRGQLAERVAITPSSLQDAWHDSPRGSNLWAGLGGYLVR